MSSETHKSGFPLPVGRITSVLFYAGLKVAIVVGLFVLGPPALGALAGKTGAIVSPVDAMLLAAGALAVALWESTRV